MGPRLPQFPLYLGLLLTLSVGCQSPSSPLSSSPYSNSTPRQASWPTGNEEGATHQASVIRQVQGTAEENGESVVIPAVVSAEIGPDSLSAQRTTEPAESPVWNLETFEELALIHNPAIQQASAAAYKASGIRFQVGRLPNPTIGYLGEQLGDRGTDMHGGFVAQDFVLGGKLRLNEAVLNHQVQSLMWELETQRQRVLTDVRLKFYEANALQQRLTLVDDFLVIARDGVQMAQRRQEALVGSRPEVLQAEIQLQEVELLRRKTDLALRGVWGELIATAGVPDLVQGRIEGALDLSSEARDWEATWLELVESSPQISAASWRVNAARANLERQRVQPIPNLGVELGMGHDHGTGGEFGRAMLGLPLPIYNRNDGNIQAAWADYCRATQEVERLKLTLKADLAKVAREYDSAVATVQQYSEKILPRAKESLKLSEQAYATDEFEFLQVLLARRTFFESQLAFIQARMELAQADAMLNGFLMTGGLSAPAAFDGGDELRGQALSGQ